MIISASRRTDLPAFYAKWFMNRIKAGYCLVPNPFNSKQVARVSLRPEDVDAIVFWTKNAEPLIPCLPELDALGYRYYFQYTVNAYSRELEPCLPSLDHRLTTFRRLSEILGPERVIWRYDPIILSNYTDSSFHKDSFARIADQLTGSTRRIVVSLVDYYQKTDRRLSRLEKEGWVFNRVQPGDPDVRRLLGWLHDYALDLGIKMQSCAENEDLSDLGIPHGNCIDGDLIHSLWGIPILRKDPNQRSACGCVVSKDIGVCDTCLHGCTYCYATHNHSPAASRYHMHLPTDNSLLGNLTENNPAKGENTQPSLF